MIALIRENQYIHLSPAETGDGTLLAWLGQSDVLRSPAGDTGLSES